MWRTPLAASVDIQLLDLVQVFGRGGQGVGSPRGQQVQPQDRIPASYLPHRSVGNGVPVQIRAAPRVRRRDHELARKPITLSLEPAAHPPDALADDHLPAVLQQAADLMEEREPQHVARPGPVAGHQQRLGGREPPHGAVRRTSLRRGPDPDGDAHLRAHPGQRGHERVRVGGHRQVLRLWWVGVRAGCAGLAGPGGGGWRSELARPRWAG